MDRERIYANLIEARHLTLEQIAALTDYQILNLYYRPGEDGDGGDRAAPGESVYSDGGADNDFWLFWSNCRAYGRTDGEAVDLWCERRPERAAEAVIDPDWTPPELVAHARTDRPDAASE